MKRIAFILDGFELQSPGQQLLDRFLQGWNEHGEFKRAAGKVVLAAAGASENALLQNRVKEFELEIAPSPQRAMANAELTVIVPGTLKTVSREDGSVADFVKSLAPGASCYVDGGVLLKEDPTTLARICSDRSLKLQVSRAAAHLIPLPVKPALPASSVRKGLLVGYGTSPDMEIDSLYALAPYIAFPPMDEFLKLKIEKLGNGEVWNFLHRPEWKPLLAAAISRSDTMKGDAEKDGRTQDIVGLQLIEKLAVNPRGWHLRGSGLELAIVNVEGAVADFNLAVAAHDRIHSAQLYRPPLPAQEHYSGLASWIVTTSGRSMPTDDRDMILRAGIVKELLST